jgi:hypothetical protein
MCISHISSFLVFVTIFLDLQCVFLTCHDSVFSPSSSYSVHFSSSTFFSFSHHIPGPTVFVCHFPPFFTFSRHILCPTICISHFYVFQCFSPYLTSYRMYFSFSMIFAILQVLKCAFLIFYVFQCFSPLSRSYSVFFSFCTFFSDSCHISRPTVFISHFLRF